MIPIDFQCGKLPVDDEKIQAYLNPPLETVDEVLLSPVKRTVSVKGILRRVSNIFMQTDTCSDHCITLLLSDSMKEQFQMSCDHIHSTTCPVTTSTICVQCELLRELAAELLQCTSSKLQ